MSSFILGERSAILKGNSLDLGGSNYHVFDVSSQLNCLKRALRVISDTATNYGSNGILLIGKSPEKISRSLRFANPYEEILKSAAIASGASFFSGDSQT